jgi:hypothetical protein
MVVSTRASIPSQALLVQPIGRARWYCGCDQIHQPPD